MYTGRHIGPMLSNGGSLALPRKLLAQLEARMQATSQKFGSWTVTLTDGTVLRVSIIKNGLVPIYKAVVISGSSTSTPVIPSDFIYQLADTQTTYDVWTVTNKNVLSTQTNIVGSSLAGSSEDMLPASVNTGHLKSSYVNGAFTKGTINWDGSNIFWKGIKSSISTPGSYSASYLYELGIEGGVQKYRLMFAQPNIPKSLKCIIEDGVLKRDPTGPSTFSSYAFALSGFNFLSNSIALHPQGSELVGVSINEDNEYVATILSYNKDTDTFSTKEEHTLTGINLLCHENLHYNGEGARGDGWYIQGTSSRDLLYIRGCSSLYSTYDFANPTLIKVFFAYEKASLTDNGAVFFNVDSEEGSAYSNFNQALVFGYFNVRQGGFVELYAKEYALSLSFDEVGTINSDLGGMPFYTILSLAMPVGSLAFNNKNYLFCLKVNRYQLKTTIPIAFSYTWCSNCWDTPDGDSVEWQIVETLGSDDLDRYEDWYLIDSDGQVNTWSSLIGSYSSSVLWSGVLGSHFSAFYLYSSAAISCVIYDPDADPHYVSVGEYGSESEFGYYSLPNATFPTTATLNVDELNWNISSTGVEAVQMKFTVLGEPQFYSWLTPIHRTLTSQSNYKLITHIKND